jgi:hypothetical protein
MAVEYLVPTMLNGMIHEPVRVIGCRWVPKVVTTDPPKYIPHTEYSWAFGLVAEVPLLAALLLEDEDGLYWGRLGRRSAAAALTIRLSFFPFDWNTSDFVRINLYQLGLSESSGVDVTVDDAPLKRDPRGVVRLDLSDGGVVQTGTLIGVGTLNSHSTVSAALVVVALSDTESCRCNRWRIKRRVPVDLPFFLSFLKTGRWAGFSPRHRMPPEFSRLAVTEHGGDVVVRFTSIPIRYDIASDTIFLEIGQELNLLLAQYPSRSLILDFEGREFFFRDDFVGRLVRLKKNANRRHGILKLCDLPPHATHRLRLAKLMGFFTICQSLDDALAGRVLDPD